MSGAEGNSSYLRRVTGLSEGQYFSEGLTNRIVVQCWGREDSAIVCVENKGPPEHIALFILNVHGGSRALP